jgi:glycosyltransferase involved in cell wall biosynthesis
MSPMGRKLVPQGDKRRPRLLYLAFYFPPTRASGVYRSRAMANHFAAAGWDVTVLTVPKIFFTDYLDSYDPSLEATLHPDIRIERVDFDKRHWERDIRRISWLRANIPALPMALDKAIHKRVFPERYATWGMNAVLHALKLDRGQKFDAVMATGNPFVSFAAAWAIGKALRIPYVVDYRDAWTFNQFSEEIAFPYHSPVWAWEQRVLRGAQEAVFVNEGMRAWHAQRYPDVSQRMTVVLNGWEPELLGQVPFRRPDPQQPLRFGYVGTVTEPMPLETLFEAWEKARSGPELADARLEIFGHLGFFPHTATALRARLPEESSGVEYMGGVPKAELASTYEHLDVLVFCVPGAKYVTSGKVYEYMAAGKPIVSVHEPDIAAVDVLKGHPLWFGIDSLDPASVADAMARAAAKARSMTQADVDAAREHAAHFTRDAVLEPFERRMRRYVGA